MLIPFDENEQEIVLNDHNQTREPSQQIPNIIRNYETGWPLLQMSLFSPNFENGAVNIRYENVLGGGKCSYMPIPAYFLAILVSKIPGIVDIQFESIYGTFIVDRKRFGGAISTAVKGYKVYHHHAEIKIEMWLDGFGKALKIEILTGDCKKYNIDYQTIFQRARFNLRNPNTDFYLVTFDNSDDIFYSREQLTNGLDSNKAIFYQGQVFLDLGAFLKNELKIPEIEQHFRRIFKVDEFIALKDSNPGFKPLSLIEDESDLHARSGI